MYEIAEETREVEDEYSFPDPSQLTFHNPLGGVYADDELDEEGLSRRLKSWSEESDNIPIIKIDGSNLKVDEEIDGRKRKKSLTWSDDTDDKSSVDDYIDISKMYINPNGKSRSHKSSKRKNKRDSDIDGHRSKRSSDGSSRKSSYNSDVSSGRSSYSECGLSVKKNKVSSRKNSHSSDISANLSCNGTSSRKSSCSSEYGRKGSYEYTHFRDSASRKSSYSDVSSRNRSLSHCSIISSRKSSNSSDVFYSRKSSNCSDIFSRKSSNASDIFSRKDSNCSDIFSRKDSNCSDIFSRKSSYCSDVFRKDSICSDVFSRKDSAGSNIIPNKTSNSFKSLNRKGSRNRSVSTSSDCKRSSSRETKSEPEEESLLGPYDASTDVTLSSIINHIAYMNQATSSSNISTKLKESKRKQIKQVSCLTIWLLSALF